MKKIIFGVLLSSIILVGCSSNDNSANIAKLEKTIESLQLENENLKNGQGLNEVVENTFESSAEQDVSNDIKGLNEDVVYSDSDNTELVQLKIVKASTNQSSFPDYMISMDDYDTENMIAITVEYKNLGLDDKFYVNPADFVAFDASGKAYEITSQQEGQDSLSPGRGSQSTLYWLVPDAQKVNEIEIDYSPMVLYGAPTQTFKVPVEH